MTPLEIALIPGTYGLRIILAFFEISPYALDQDFQKILIWLMSWLFWITVLRGVWIITLRMFGFHTHRGYRR